MPLHRVNVMSETADVILTHGGECLYFFEHLRHHHGGYKPDKDQALCSEERLADDNDGSDLGQIEVSG